MGCPRLTFLVCLITTSIPTSLGQQTGQTLDLGALSFSTVPIATVSVVFPFRPLKISRFTFLYSLSSLLAPIRRPMDALFPSKRPVAGLASQTSGLCPPSRASMRRYPRVQSRIKLHRYHPSSRMLRVLCKSEAQSFCCPWFSIPQFTP